MIAKLCHYHAEFPHSYIIVINLFAHMYVLLLDCFLQDIDLDHADQPIGFWNDCQYLLNVFRMGFTDSKTAASKACRFPVALILLWLHSTAFVCRLIKSNIFKLISDICLFKPQANRSYRLCLTQSDTLAGKFGVAKNNLELNDKQFE